jgi:hypothetical protein
MIDLGLDELPTRDLLERAAGCRTAANRADAEQLAIAQIYADRYHPTSRGLRNPEGTGKARTHDDGRERAIVLGGDGCPEIAEFAVAEFAVVIGVSCGVGRDLIADAVALRYRFPQIWARIQAGEATPWIARKIVRACAKLDYPAARYVDERVAGIVDTISPYRLSKIVSAAAKTADPTLAASEAAEAAKSRGVFVRRGQSHGNKAIWIIAPAAAANRFNARISQVADALKALGDTRPVQHRRADAIGILPDSRFTEELLDQARRAGGAGDRSASSAAPADPDPSVDPHDERIAGPVSEPDHEDSGRAPEDGAPMDDAALRALDARLAQIKQDAYANQSTGGQVRPGQTEIVVHLTDLAAATGTGVVRAEAIGPMLAAQLTELIGHGPYTVKPVIDLNDAVSVDAYEIPTRIRDRVKLMYPAELFPYGNRETSSTIDLDHIEPYDPHGPTGQTSTANLAPLGRFSHRVKTHGRGWSVRRIDKQTLEWTTPHGFVFHVDPTGTHRVQGDAPDPGDDGGD